MRLKQVNNQIVPFTLEEELARDAEEALWEAGAADRAKGTPRQQAVNSLKTQIAQAALTDPQLKGLLIALTNLL